MAVLLDAVKGIGLIEFDISKTSIGPPTAKKLAVGTAVPCTMQRIFCGRAAAAAAAAAVPHRSSSTSSYSCRLQSVDIEQ